MPTVIKKSVLDRVIKDKVLVAQIAKKLDRSPQTIEGWIKEGSMFCTLRDFYETVQDALGVTDKEMFEKV